MLPRSLHNLLKEARASPACDAIGGDWHGTRVGIDLIATCTYQIIILSYHIIYKFVK